MKKLVLLSSLTAALVGWSVCFEASELLAQEQDAPPRQFPGQGERPPRPKGQPPQGQPGPRPERQGDRQGPPDGERKGEGGYQGRSNPNAMLMRMSGRMLIVAPGADAQLHQEVEEDLTTMLHLLERIIEKDLGNSDDEVNAYRNMPTLLTSDSRAMYLDDYGVMFSLRTPQVLYGVANAEKPSPEPPGPRGNQWERARQELFGGRGGDGMREARPGLVQYDAAKVEALKESLTGLLRDASNLRHLKRDQSVSIVLAGSPSFGARPPLNAQDDAAKEGSPLERFRSQMSRATYLVLRAKKADIDSFAQGKLTAEQFKAKVSVVNN
jgi:hypothetical protein